MLSPGAIIKLFREKKGLKQNVLAKKLKITPTYLSLIEKSKREGSIQFYKDIAKELSIPVWVLLWDDFELPSKPTKDDIKIKQKIDEIIPELRSFIIDQVM